MNADPQLRYRLRAADDAVRFDVEASLTAARRGVEARIDGGASRPSSWSPRSWDCWCSPDGARRSVNARTSFPSSLRPVLSFRQAIGP